jgi:hypothetical protein
MTQDEIIEMAIQGHASTRDAIRWAMKQEREACLKIAESMSLTSANMSKTWRTGCRDVAEAIKARGEV